MLEDLWQAQWIDIYGSTIIAAATFVFAGIVLLWPKKKR